MADYREIHCPYGDDFEGGDECDRCEQYELCMETSPADVVERSKIDKAIEEIESKKYIIDIDRAIEILKRNIGE